MYALSPEVLSSAIHYLGSKKPIFGEVARLVCIITVTFAHSKLFMTNDRLIMLGSTFTNTVSR